MAEFVMQEVTSRDEFDAIVDVEFAAMHEPYRPEFPWMHPVHGHTVEDRIAGMKADADRRWQSHVENSGSHWFTVTHTPSREIVGVAEWQINMENPFPNGPVKLECTWFPKGTEACEFATNIINQCYYPRMNWMDRPHLTIGGMAVVPSMRKRGIGTMLMQWGLQKAEELDLEIFLEASDPGLELFQHFDFQYLLTLCVNTRKKCPSQTWMKMHQETSPIIFSLMWRPAPQDLREGTTKTFWQTLKQ